MFTKRTLSAVVLALAIAAPVAAQSDASVLADEARRAAATAKRRAEIEAARRRAEVERTGRTDARIEAGRRGSSGSSRIPRGHLPPRGACRVWIDGVPPGQQPAVTSCAQAEQDRLRYGLNARVIYGDVESFPGRGQGKFTRDRTGARSVACAYRDAVVAGDRVIDVCRDANGNVINQRGRVVRDDDDDDRFESGNRGRSSAAKATKLERRGAGKGGKGRGE
jgi:hypothetical protein